ncbi:hypothetical protein PENFLA_c050G07807 [Penicillium flavigenum]|uniref:Uncharacterized protein n=1 Tax=Penicillium flavigenum TaxID=254877 RepID=A0A1V6SHX9_9EURO|nr:hypothetical protein PENFLA_c050G07807 [Penicillium flavigenum]
MSNALETSVSKNECREILNELFLGVLFETNYDPDPSLEEFLRDSCLSHGVTKETAIKFAKLGAALAKEYFPLHSPDLQRLIGLYTSYFFLVDDLGHGFLDDITGILVVMQLEECRKIHSSNPLPHFYLSSTSTTRDCVLAGSQRA